MVVRRRQRERVGKSWRGRAERGAGRKLVLGSRPEGRREKKNGREEARGTGRHRQGEGVGRGRREREEE